MSNTWTPRSVAARPHPKLDPRLSAVVELDATVFATAPAAEAVRDGAVRAPEKDAGDLVRSGPLAFLRGPAATSRGASVLESGARVPVFVTVKRPDALKSLPVRPRSAAGTVATMEVGLTEIRALEANDDVVAVEWTGGVRPQAAPLPRAIRVSPRQAVGLDLERSPSLDGRGTCIGIVDVDGIDFYHPDFVEPDGATRVLALWDQSARDRGRGRAGKAPEPWGYGLELTRREIYEELDPHNRVRCSIVDHDPLKASHGTKVASIAAGSGAADPHAAGVAPGASIVFVNTVNSGPSALAAMTELAEAVDYVFQRAGKMPCVVNISLGDNLGPHDGESPVERFIDALLEAPGRAVTVAAGNAGDGQRHARGTLGDGVLTADIGLDVGARETVNAVVEIWHDAEDGVDLEILAPGALGRSPRIEPLGLPCAFDAGETRVLAANVKRYPGSKSGHVRVELFPGTGGGSLAGGRWTLRLSARGGVPCEWHAWVDHPRAVCAPSEAGSPPPITLTSPATCRSAIAVGAFHPGTGEALFLSSAGPARGGAGKPEIVACGAGVMAASAGTPARYDLQFSGTSAAAPQVAGLIALLFQRLGAGLSAAEAKRLLREAADTAGLSLPDPRHGAGRARLPRLPGDEISARRETSRATQQQQPRKTIMENKEAVRGGAGGGAPAGRPKDACQFGVGFYTMTQGGTQVGELLVLAGTSQGTTVEHWALYSAYRSPDALNTTQTTTWTYEGPANMTASQFKNNLASGTAYIEATCVQEIIP